MAKLIFAPFVLAMLLAAGPAAAQFGSIFSDSPPRPPGDVPRGAPPPNFPGRNAPPRFDPGTLPPPGRQGIQSQPLPPPPGAPAAPLDTRERARVAPQAPEQQQGVPAPPAQTLPGLPPGQRQLRGAPQPANPPPQQPASTAPQPDDEIVVQPPEKKLVNPTAVFSGLDKITGRTISFDVAINETVQFGALQVTPRACYSRPPTETPNTDAFVAVDEVTLQGEVKRVFTGWMFAASPGLHAVEHPIYDVWLTDCKGATPAVAEVPPEPAKPEAKPAAKPAPPRPPAQRRTTQPAPNFLSPFR
ncbi:MAG: DUF2155 domain-containing protein [Pseudolabrys sp.]